MSWNYRILGHKKQNGDYYYSLHEVYYTDGEPDSCTEEALKLDGFETPKELLHSLAVMLADGVAHEDEILNYEDF